MDQSEPTLYFDGACPVCSREMAMYRRQAGADGVHRVDIARCDTTQLGADLSRDAAMARLHLRQPDGTLVSGAAAFTLSWQSLPRWAWFGRLMRARPGLWLLESLYRAFLCVRPFWQGRR